MLSLQMRNPLVLVLSAVIALTAAPAVFSQATASSIPIADFFRRPLIAAPALSPSGDKIAMLVAADNGRMGLAVSSVTNPGKFVGIAKFDDADIRSFSWVNDQRLVFDAIDLQAGLGEQQGSGLYAVNADGSDFLWLIERNGNYRPVGIPAVRPLPNRHRFVGPVGDGSDDVFVMRGNFMDVSRVPTTTMLRLNTKTMSTRTLVKFAPPGALGWVLDRQGEPRAVISGDEKTGATVYLRKGTSEDWESIAKFDAYDLGPDRFEPVSFDLEGRLYVSRAQQNPEQTLAVYRLDMQTRKPEAQPFLSLKGFDFEGGLLFDGKTKKLIGARFATDAPGSLWFDEGMKQIQADIDKQLPNTINMINCTNCEGGRYFVVSASSDKQTPVYFLYDKSQKKLQLIGSTRPWLDSKQMAERDFVRIKVRDGLEIPVHVTKPKGKGPFPTVVMIHGGPYVRGGVWGFDRDAQFLASRGYLVVEPEFRGSTGYGQALFRAGWKQWGLKMQDDMTDATKWAIEKGLADPKRIAIAGGSYGGYAAMMGLVREPALYRAGVNFVGVTDIELMYDIGWSDFSGSTWSRYGMPRLVGDRNKDAAQLKQTSPLQRANEIKQPVFMAYGEDDLRVPLPHGTKMRDALKSAGNQNVEWIQYPNEGHGFLLEKNNIDFWGRMLTFLDKHLK